jgi:hypothetical protein
MKIDNLVTSLKPVSFVIPADPGSWSRAGAGIQEIQIAPRNFSHRLTLVKSATLVSFEKCNPGTIFRSYGTSGVNADLHGMRIGYHARFAGVQS